MKDNNDQYATMYDLIINAPNIHAGGGKVLLQAILQDLARKSLSCLLIAHEKLDISTINTSDLKIRYVKHSMFSRLYSEFYLKKISKKSKQVLMFGNLPPVFKLESHVIVYLQNLYVISNVSLKGFSRKQKLRIVIERILFKLFKKQVDDFYVQTRSMKKNLEKHTNIPICIFPFVALTKKIDYTSKKIDYIYPASGEPHKNHRNLIESWVLLASKNVTPSLYITLDEELFPDLVLWINEKVKKHNLNIVNLGNVSSYNEMLGYIQPAFGMIFPSKLESLGLPLIEARMLNIPILAPELDYVRDIVKPEFTFNPDSPSSICGAVLRHKGIYDEQQIFTADEFICDLTK